MAFLLSFQVLFLLNLFDHVNCNEENKRIIYHCDNDVMQIITALQTEVAAFKNKTEALEGKVVALETASQNKIAALESELTTLKTTMQFGGVTYVRWGRTTCPSNGTEFIYKGYMAGAHYNETGGGANNLCLPENPTWSRYMDGYNYGAVIYGTEIEVNNVVKSLIFGNTAHNQDIPCAVCRSSRASHVMLPARANCYGGWTKEYGGYLVAAYPSLHKADYVCLDSDLEFVSHGAADDNDHIMRVVEVRCGNKGSLHCPPFVDGRELACVVCTK